MFYIMSLRYHLEICLVRKKIYMFKWKILKYYIFLKIQNTEFLKTYFFFKYRNVSYCISNKIPVQKLLNDISVSNCYNRYPVNGI